MDDERFAPRQHPGVMVSSTFADLKQPHPVLLFEAIGGGGASMLTWEWAVNHASGARAGLVGTFWYSYAATMPLR
jgi:hypothetical protein